MDSVENPTREVYIFTGWYQDPECTFLWDIQNDTVKEQMTLYAGWKEETDARQ